MSKKTNILVTGGAGYIGAVLVPALLSEGFQVTVIDNFMYNQTSLLDCCHYPDITLIHGDIRNKSLLKKHLSHADIIIPLACLTGAPICDKYPDKAYQINYHAIEYILENKSASQRIIFPSTNSGYGIGQDNIFCNEETPLTPVSLYGRLKVNIEKKFFAQAMQSRFVLQHFLESVHECAWIYW
ncbi:MAG: HrEpiB [Candidatus Magnetoglobus multicellularis str. Araruama]|uniref:UDP-glucose 4-epimerase n=1 Tax=Candidatus Magnetoglobus multicellularis str. Araruama TaxID=890399 RepID=A0A1V1PCZ3_9BACT|nr:MAG: HrEpiB [Candidatus Magnetoglobus multicellularis str. Araruama]